MGERIFFHVFTNLKTPIHFINSVYKIIMMHAYVLWRALSLYNESLN